MFHLRTAARRQPQRSASFSSLSIFPLILFITLFIISDGGAQAATITVPSGGDFQAALNAAQPGDTILLQAGASFTGPFSLPDKGPSTDFITIRSSAPDSSLPQPGQRISPAASPLLPKLLSPGHGDPALATSPSAHHFRFIAVEFRTIDAAAFTYDLIRLGDGSSAQNSLVQVPHHLSFDRCLVTAFPTQSLKRGIALNSAETEIINSYVAGFKVVAQDSQAIAGWNGPGPFHLVNNYLEAAGENLLFGGATASIANLVPSDIEVRRNHFTKPLAWKVGEAEYAGTPWQVKNLFELKSARRVVVEGNLFEQNWVDAQSGFAIVLTVRGDNAWATIEEVDFRNNVVRRTASVFNILGHDTLQVSAIGHGLRIQNNLFTEAGDARWGGGGSGGMLLKVSEMAGLIYEHNTSLQSGNITMVYGPVSSGMEMRNNITPHNEYGIIGDGTGPGLGTLVKYFPGAVVERNLIAGADAGRYPADNFYPSSMAGVQFVDSANGNYRLVPGAPYTHAGTDGKDLGCDFDALDAAMADHVIPPGPTPTPTPTPTPAPTPTPNGLSSPGLVAVALQWATTLSNSAGTTEPQINPLVGEIEQAIAAFNNEATRFASPAQIDTELRAALYFSRAADALAAAQGPSAGVQSRLRICAQHLQRVSTSMSGAGTTSTSGTTTAALSSSSVIGPASAYSGATMQPLLSVESLGAIVGDPNQSPLATQSAVATPDAAGALPYELAGVSVTVGGRAAQLLSVAPDRVSFAVPPGLSVGDAEVLVTLQEGYVSRGVVNIIPVAPGLFTTDSSGQAQALNSADRTSGSFAVTTDTNLGADKRTRLMLFATGVHAAAANSDATNDVRGQDGHLVAANVAESVAVEAATSDGRVFSLPVEYAGPEGVWAGIDQVNVILIPQLSGAGTVRLTLIIGGARSNTATINVR